MIGVTVSDYAGIERHCRAASRVTNSLVDGFLLSYCDERDNPMRDMLRTLDQHQELLRGMPEGWLEHTSAQYIAFRLFRDRGFARKYRAHPALRERSEAERAWFVQQLDVPWRYCFCRIIDQPHRDFFEMQNVATGENFLLYSPAMTAQVEEQGMPMFSFLLIGFNDACWQTYGPLMHFHGLFPGDLVLIGSQIQRGVRRLEDLPRLIDRDPIFFALLWHWGNAPATVHGEDFLIVHRADIRKVALDPGKIGKAFMLERKGNVLRLGLKRWRRHPHFAECFYDASQGLLIARAMTQRSWTKLTEALAEAGVEVRARDTVRGSALAMFMVEQLFGRNLQKTKYDDLFAEPVDPVRQAEFDRINDFLGRYLEAVNGGQDPDIDALAHACGLDAAEARQILSQISHLF